MDAEIIKLVEEAKNGSEKAFNKLYISINQQFGLLFIILLKM